MSPHTLFLLAMAATAAGQSTRQRPVVMPFGLSYGEHTLGAWYGIPVTVGTQKFDLSISTSLSQSWVPGIALCEADTNVTHCTEKAGGTFDESKSPTWKTTSADTALTDDLLKGYYNSTISPSLLSDNKKLLALQGDGDSGTDTITLVSNTGSFKMDTQALGIMTSGNRDLMANGYLSLQQMALSLYANNFTPSPTYHLFHGKSAWSNDTELALSTQGVGNWGAYVLIFGGYDRNVLNLNTTQQYPLLATTLSTTTLSTTPLTPDTPLPESSTTSYSMHLPLDNIIYRWTTGGKTDNSLLPSPTLSIIDSTTPWIWLPKSAFTTLLTLTDAVWNSTYSAYTMPQCNFGDSCSDLQYQASQATLDFAFQGMRGERLSLTFDTYMEVRYYPEDGENAVWILPIREVPDGAPVVLGRPFLANVHLWVDFAEMYWGMAQGNVTAQVEMASDVVGWEREGHAKVTNETVLVVRPEGASVGGGAGGGKGAGEGGEGEGEEVVVGEKKGGLELKAVAAIAACGGAVGIALVAVGIALFRRKKKAKELGRSESSHELRPTDGQKEQMRPHELPQGGQFRPHELPQEGQFRPHELPPNESAYYKPQGQGQFPQAELAGGYYKQQEMDGSSGKFQIPPPQQNGYYTPVMPVSPAFQQQGMYHPPPPTYDGQGGQVYYEMDGGRGSYPTR